MTKWVFLLKKSDRKWLFKGKSDKKWPMQKKVAKSEKSDLVGTLHILSETCLWTHEKCMFILLCLVHSKHIKTHSKEILPMYHNVFHCVSVPTHRL